MSGTGGLSAAFTVTVIELQRISADFVRNGAAKAAPGQVYSAHIYSRCRFYDNADHSALWRVDRIRQVEQRRGSLGQNGLVR